jgi:hypothetical protein
VAMPSKLLMHYGCDRATGEFMRASHSLFLLELGISSQPLQESYVKYSFLLTHSWMKMLWEKVSMFSVRTVIADVGTEFLQEGDRFLMQVFFKQGYSPESLIRLNWVRIFWQALFLSDILTASGKKINTEIIGQPRIRHKQSRLRWPTEHLPEADFQLWRNAVMALCPSRNTRTRLGLFIAPTHRIWDWRWDEGSGCLCQSSWLWENISMAGGYDWLLEAITDGSLLAVTDGSYIRELYPNLCSAAFVLECKKGQGCLIGSFLESLRVANTYRGELLGLMAVQLILLSADRIHGSLLGGVEVVSNCLGALRWVTDLRAYQIPSRCKNSDNLKNILVNCCTLSFTIHYLHEKAHQDDSTSFINLSRKAQLNCICDHTTKQRIAINGPGNGTSGRMFPLEPIEMFSQGEKLTSNTGKLLQFWAHQQLARTYYHSKGIILHDQFDETDWWSLQKTLLSLTRLFQLWAAKHMNRIAGSMSFLLHQDGRCNLCPSCATCIKTCQHIAHCPEAGRALAFAQSMDELELWFSTNNTHPDMQSLLLRYNRGRGTVTCLECAISLELPPVMQNLARSQNIISWDLFMMGMLSKQMAVVQSIYLIQHHYSRPVSKWLSGLITQLLQVTHGQWIYRYVLVHDRSTGTLVSAHKEDLMEEIAYQLELGAEGLVEDDRFLLECNFDELTTTNGKQQEYWILAIQAAREACRLCDMQGACHSAADAEPRKGKGKTRVQRTMHILSTTSCGPNNSQGHNILEGESPLSAVPTAMLFCTRACGV